MDIEKPQNGATLDVMFQRNTYRIQLNNVLKEQSIHATQIKDGFSLTEDTNFQTDPGIYTMDKIFHNFGTNFRMLHAHYVPGTQQKILDRQQLPCKPAESIHLLPNTSAPTVQDAITYIRGANSRAHIMLHAHGIPTTGQNRGTLLGLAAYRCTGGVDGAIAALPDCRHNPHVYEDVYFPFIRAGATLSQIVEACAWRVGAQGPITYMMGRVPVRFGTLNLAEDSQGLNNLQLGKYKN